MSSLPDAPAALDNGAAGAAKPTDRRRVPFHREDYPKVEAMFGAADNPHWVDRDMMTGIGHALAASLPEDMDFARAIFLEWAALWEGGCDTAENERVFDTLGGKHHGDALTLLHHARKLGVQGPKNKKWWIGSIRKAKLTAARFAAETIGG